MKQTIIRYGLISGVISSILMLIVSLIGQSIGFQTFAEYGVWVGFSAIILSLTLVFIGIKSYRRSYYIWESVSNRHFRYCHFLRMLFNHLGDLLLQLFPHFYG